MYLSQGRVQMGRRMLQPKVRKIEKKKKKSQWRSKNVSLLNLGPRSSVVHSGGNTFLYRIKDLTVQSSTLPEEAAMTVILRIPVKIPTIKVKL